MSPPSSDRARPAERPPSPALLVVAVGTVVVAVGFAAILIRLCDAPPLSIALWRNVIGAGLLLPVVVVRRGLPTGRALSSTLVAGVLLALHFWLWIASLAHTSVAASVVLVCTQPIFVVVLGRVFLGERTSALASGGIAIALVGSAVISVDGSFGDAAPLGNALALGGAVAIAVYVLLGRAVRTQGIGAIPYAFTLYVTAASTLLVAAVVTQTPLTGFPPSTWLWLTLMAIGPQILGHTVFNWALGHIKASVLASTILLEPLISTALAAVLLGETPPAQTLAGATVVLTGLTLVIRGRH